MLDSAQLGLIEAKATRWVDLGSGGGFPGLVLAFLLAEREGGAIDLVESNRKKASFLQAVVGQFGLPARIVARRIEDAPALVPAPQVVTARALAPLSALLDLAAPWLSAGARGLFHGINGPIEATRYHSLVVKRETCPEILSIEAESGDGMIMALSHRELPVHGVQFHPESIASEHGATILRNFLDLAERWSAASDTAALSATA
ncbi:MAG: class I SAM-dependent methyltransferase [Bosea sp.]|nr:class I SAM-dependent methyltransferase [Bosea sp. (in: a-proteobacteria)]